MMSELMYFYKAVRYFFLLLPLSLTAQPVVVGEIMNSAQLGNQLFMIAATVSLALDHDATPVFPDISRTIGRSISLNYQKVFPKLITHLSDTTILSKRFIEPSFRYHPIPYEPNMTIRGYFQSEKYFANHKEEIIELFSPSEEIVKYLTNKYNYILDHPNVVSVHLRSYLQEDPTGAIHITYGRKYIEKAMDYFPQDTLFVVFSNDIPWCKKELKDLKRLVFYSEEEPYYLDFYFMSLCKHNIICNSSYSWWAAYLNKNPQKIIIAPKLWFNPNAISNTQDLKPPTWIEVAGI